MVSATPTWAQAATTRAREALPRLQRDLDAARVRLDELRESLPDPDGHLTRRQRRERLTAVEWLQRRAEDRVWLTAAAAANGVSPAAYLTGLEKRLVA